MYHMYLSIAHCKCGLMKKRVARSSKVVGDDESGLDGHDAVVIIFFFFLQRLWCWGSMVPYAIAYAKILHPPVRV